MRYLPNGYWMQKADAHTIQEIGIPSLVLMERAALKMVEIMRAEEIKLEKPLIVCGSGNNGGDGFAIARLLHQSGSDVTVVFAGKEKSMSEECRTQMQIIRNMGLEPVTEIPDDEYTVVIDAVFGVGLSREITGNYADVITQMNEISAQKAAVDIPSGIDSASGKVLGVAFQADLTVSFQCEKLGTVLFPGKTYAGKTVAANIGIDTEFYSGIQEIPYTLEQKDIWKFLPKRKANSHKGSYGKVLMITGSAGMAGAAYLSAKAAYCCGAGLVQIYTDEKNRAVLQQCLPEAIISVYEEYSEEQLKKKLQWADVVCIGCGLGQTGLSESLLTGTMKHCKVPCVIDADGINLLACHMDLLRQAEFPIVLTPHMKEMSGMLGCTVSELQEERMSKLNQFVCGYPVVCALKDSRTIVAERLQANFVNTAGNQAMAKAGSGDVLAGVVTALLAQKLTVYESAVLGVYLHACGGDEAKKACGSYSVLAEDLIAGIRTCLKKAEEKANETI